MKAVIRKHPTASYFLLAFLLSWGGILAVTRAGAMPAPPAEAERLFTRVFLAMLLGPSVAGVAITAIVGGRWGLREFRNRLLAWRVRASWYFVALLTAPLAVITAVLLLSPLSPDFIPGFLNPTTGEGPIGSGSQATLPLVALLVGASAGFFEELGWTGVAVPNLRARHGIVVTGLLVGLVWGAWHFLAILWGAGSSFGSVPIALYLAVALFSFLPPYRVLMVWVYDRTGSLLIAILMHASLTASMLFIGPPVVGGALLMYDLVFAVLLWGIAGIVLRTSRQHSARVVAHTP